MKNITHKARYVIGGHLDRLEGLFIQTYKRCSLTVSVINFLLKLFLGLRYVHRMLRKISYSLKYHYLEMYKIKNPHQNFSSEKVKRLTSLVEFMAWDNLEIFGMRN